ncbi:hypothetical protein ACWC5I_01195 [Kitasatospora sp. NPDC001574]
MASAPTAGADQLVQHPAGHDGELRVAVEDLRAGRWMSTKSLLAATGKDWARRSSRTQVLGTVAARSDVLDRWMREEPGSAGLAVMRARAAVELAVAASRRIGERAAGRLESAARDAVAEAAAVEPDDPVPWLCLLTLAALDPAQRMPGHRHPAPDTMLPDGPWGLFWEAHQRDPFNREAHHRMFRYWLRMQRWSATDFVNFVLPHVPAGSPLAVLPLYLSVEQYRNEQRRDAARRQWTREPHLPRVLRAYESWRSAPDPAGWPVVDLSHLAHALWAGVQMEKAVEVFEALAPFASHQPWSSVADSPDRGEDFLLTARLQAYSGRATAMA